MSFKVFVPSHISCFFSVYNDRNILKSGSSGAGILLDKGVTTKVKKSSRDEIILKINGKSYENPSISKKTGEYIRDKFQIDEGVAISQDVEVPMGSGFGTSASSAIGVGIALNNLFGLDLGIVNVYQIAHIMEVEFGTGLGDVIAESSKGIVIRKKPGAPGFGEIIRIIKDDLFVITKTFGEIDTKSIIQNPQISKKVNELGLKATKEFLKNQSINNLLRISFNFAKKTSLICDEVLDSINELNKYTLGSSMAMLGNTVFALSKTPKEDLENVSNQERFLITKVDNQGVKIF
ncbi:MAG: GHMP kinase [Methanobrevibacter sp.]|jgi:pantoate kinase|nr:GHMP kinase [Candidatus Methanovirga basalitermitum]